MLLLSDVTIPFLMASLHPIIHATCLVTTNWVFTKGLFDTTKSNDGLYNIIDSGLRTMMHGHFICVIIELLKYCLNFSMRKKNIAGNSMFYRIKVLELIKFIVYVLCIFYAQQCVGEHFD